MTDREWNENLDAAIREIFQLTVSLGGTGSPANTGLVSQKRYLPRVLRRGDSLDETDKAIV